ncbi:hypothetical protein L7F22_031097 [Adiantum nelumboides]|nr:hypothetical protein [Adiantum nelumboides]
MGVKSRVLILGRTGYIGKHIVRASIAEGHLTLSSFALLLNRPSDVDHCKPLELVKTMYGKKVAIRRNIVEADIPHTYVSSYPFVGYTLVNLMQFGKPAPPRDRVVIQGTRDVKPIFVKEEDVGTYTIKSIDDPRTLNKVLYLKPPQNIITVNEAVAARVPAVGKL